MKKVLIGFQVALCLLNIIEIKASNPYDFEREAQRLNLIDFEKEITHIAVEAIHDGIPNRYIGSARVCLDMKIDKKYGETPLTAVIKYMPEKVEWALQQGCNPNVPFINEPPYRGGYYPLYVARCCINNIELREQVFSLLFQYGADISLCPHYNDKE